MKDEMFDRDYQHSREVLNSGIDRAVAAFGRALWRSFSRAHELQWRTPWDAAPRPRRRRRTGLA